MKLATVVVLSIMAAGPVVMAQGSGTTITPLLAKDVVGMPGKALEMVTVEYAPGAVDPVHVHNAQAMVYVLEGTVVMQVKGGQPVTLKAGETFYEMPGDVHVVARNASTSKRARFVVFFMKDKDAPLLVPVK